MLRSIWYNSQQSSSSNPVISALIPCTISLNQNSFIHWDKINLEKHFHARFSMEVVNAFMIMQRWYPFSVYFFTFLSSTLHFFTEGGRGSVPWWLCYYSLATVCPLLVQLAWTWRYLDIMINWSSSDYWVATLNTLSTTLTSPSPKSISWIPDKQIRKETQGCYQNPMSHLFFYSFIWEDCNKYFYYPEWQLKEADDTHASEETQDPSWNQSFSFRLQLKIIKGLRSPTQAWEVVRICEPPISGNLINLLRGNLYIDNCLKWQVFYTLILAIIVNLKYCLI